MKRQQEIAYQLDLFTEQQQNAVHFFDNCEDVNRSEARKVKQVNEAGQQRRALKENLMTDYLICH